MSFKTATSLKSSTTLKIVVFLILAPGLAAFVLSGFKKETRKICFQKNCFVVEIVSSLGQLRRGLSFRPWLGSDKGMLFVFEKESPYSFWMKNTFIPLDIIWLDQDLKIVFIKENARPCIFSSCEIFSPSVDAKYVLEINNGEAQKSGFQLDRQLELR